MHNNNILTLNIIMQSSINQLSSLSLLHRPNLCRTTKVYETQTYSYTYQRHCSWGVFCSLFCKRTENCDSDVVNVTKTEDDCCDGFAVDPSQSSGRSRRSGYSHGSSSLRRNGCPISKWL